MSQYPALNLIRKKGDEPFRFNSESVGFCLEDFWGWSVSDLVSNATRGRLAEFIVARALGIATDNVRDEWSAHDLTTPTGLKIEVKSAAYVQSWAQKDLSQIRFSIRQSMAWSRETNLMSQESKRQADIYVFALLHHREKATINPLDLAQWSFFVVSTTKLTAQLGKGASISLNALKSLCGEPVGYRDLVVVVERAITE